ncbi:MAG: hypothetical protein EXS46_02485 [Candidatus Taylorbacteria bacterium]|nr:hypothetical protein [Candidatus Taylorbacteria bacterium]
MSQHNTPKDQKMKLGLTTYYEDGSSGITKIKKPAGAHPDSIMVIAEGILAAEKTGKRVSKIGRLKVNPFSNPKTGLVIDDNLVTRGING